MFFFSFKISGKRKTENVLWLKYVAKREKTKLSEGKIIKNKQK